MAGAYYKLRNVVTVSANVVTVSAFRSLVSSFQSLWYGLLSLWYVFCHFTVFTGGYEVLIKVVKKSLF